MSAHLVLKLEYLLSDVFFFLSGIVDKQLMLYQLSVGENSHCHCVFCLREQEVTRLQ